MKEKENNLLTFNGNWTLDWAGTSIYDVVYDKTLADRAITDNIINGIKRGY